MEYTHGLSPIKLHQTKIFSFFVIEVGVIYPIISFVVILLWATYVKCKQLETGSFIIVLLILGLLVIPIITTFKEAVKEKNAFNQLIEEGIVVSGRIEEFYGLIHGASFEVSVIDERTNTKYHYHQSCDTKINPQCIFAYVKEDNQIYVLVDENNYKNGYVLCEEYLNRQRDSQWVQREKRWDGSYKPHMNPVEAVERKSNEILVVGKLIKKTVNVGAYKSDSVRILSVTGDVTYFERESNKSYIFKGRAKVSPAVYFKMRQCKEPIEVKVMFDKTDTSKYTVYLDEALENL